MDVREFHPVVSGRDLGAGQPGNSPAPRGGDPPRKKPPSDRRARLFSAGRSFRREAADDRITGLAAEVAFYGVLGIFPGLLALAAALGFLGTVLGGDVADRAQRVVLDFLNSFLGEGTSATVDAVRSLFEEGDAALLSFASAGAVWSMWRATRASMRALAIVYDVEEQRSVVRVALVALAVAVGTLLVATLVLVMFVLGPLFGGGQAIAGAVGLGDAFATLWTWARLPLMFIVLLLWAALVFHLAPHRRTSFRADLPGAVVSGVLWLVFSAGLRLYLEIAGGANQVLGVIGGFMTVLLWVYLLSLALLVGGEVNSALLHNNDVGPIQGLGTNDQRHLESPGPT